MAKIVKMADIGERLNVSTVTVSKALSGQKGVSEELREKIIKLADEMGYVRRSARGETDDSNRKSYMIGVIVSESYMEENHSFYWKIYQEISIRANARSCFSMLEIISHETEKKGELPRMVTEQKIDGMIIMGPFKVDYARKLNTVIRIPILNLDTLASVEEGGDCVVSNNLMGGYRMTNYLFQLGHEKIGFVGTRLATSSIDDRYFGYLKSLMEHGIAWREDWVLDDRDYEIGKVDSERWFEFPKEMPTAFFCNSDLSASLLIEKLEKNGYSVPGDVSVVGFDNYVKDQFGKVGITTYEIDMKEMAKRAVHIICHKIGNSSYSTGIFMLPGKFVERDSAKRIGLAVPFV